MLKKKVLVLALTLLMVFGVAGFFTNSNNGNVGVDLVSAATALVGEEIGRQKICVVIESLTIIDIGDLEDEINVIDDEDDIDGGTINIYTNQDVKITAYHDDTAYTATNPGPFESAVVKFEIRLNASPPVGLGYKSLLGADELNAIDITGNLNGIGLANVPVQYNIGLQWDPSPPDGTYCTDVIFTLEDF